MTSNAAATANRSPRIRSAVTNGSKRLADVDGRGRDARRLRDLEHDFAAPLGGLATLAAPARLRVQSAAALALRLEQARGGLARGDAVMGDEDLIRLANAVGLELAALERLAVKAKPPAPSLADYLASKRAEAAA